MHISIVLSLAVPLALLVILGQGTKLLIRPRATRPALDVREFADEARTQDDRSSAA